MLKGKFIAVTVFPQPGVGDVIPRICQALASIERNVWVRRISNDLARGSLLSCEMIRFAARKASLSSTSLLWTPASEWPGVPLGYGCGACTLPRTLGCACTALLSLALSTA